MRAEGLLVLSRGSLDMGGLGSLDCIEGWWSLDTSGPFREVPGPSLNSEKGSLYSI